jgi:hypothetical protein
MDSFIKIIEQKKEESVDTIHAQQIETLKKYIRQGKNVFICGSIGVGKTYVLNSVLNDSNSVEIQKEHLSNKSHFLTFIKNAPRHAFIEDYDNDFKGLVERVSDGEKLTRGGLVITSVNMCMYPNFEIIFIPKHKPEKLLLLTDDNSEKAKHAAILADGNIRDFFTYLEGHDEKDTFLSPKDFIASLLCTDVPMKVYEHVEEHGHIWDIFQENYLDSGGIDFRRAAHGFSEADVVDTAIYSNGSWHLTPYFCLNALVIPKSCLGKKLVKDNVRPGSCWTKYGNYKMRFKKFTEIQRKAPSHITIDHLCLIKKYAENGNVEKMLEYDLSPQDFDVMNHLAVGSKLKQRDVTRVKKALKNAIAERSRKDL